MKVSPLPFFQQCSPWPDVPYQMNNAPSPSYNSSPNSFNLGDGYVTNTCFILPVDTAAFVSMHFIPWKIMLRTPHFLARRKYFPKAFKTFHPGIPCNAEYCLYMYCLCGGWKLSIRGPPGQLLVRTHRACTSNPQHLLTSVLEAFSTSSELAFLPHFLSWGSLGCWIPRWMTRKEILFEAKQPRFWDAILERRTNEGMFN